MALVIFYSFALEVFISAVVTAMVSVMPSLSWRSSVA